MRGLIPLARHARGFYPLATPRQRASQSAKWARSIAILGRRWILAQKMERPARIDA